MKTQIRGLALACVAAFIFTGCATAHHPTAWDYKIIYGNVTGRPSRLPALETQLDQAGADGWQVASSGNEDGLPFIVLKKAK